MLSHSLNYIFRNKARSSGTIQSIILEPEEITEAKRLWTVQAQTLLALRRHALMNGRNSLDYFSVIRVFEDVEAD